MAVRSLAILSDGLHALSDALTTLLLFITTLVSLRPPDEEHMYGHEKFELIGGLIGGVAMIGLAASLMIESILKLIENKPYVALEWGYVGFVAIGYTLCMDFLRVGTLRKAMRTESPTMKAGLYHAIADLGSTVFALLGFGLATVGFYYMDSLSSMLLSVLLVFLSGRLIWKSAMDLSDTVSKDVLAKIKAEMLGTKDACELDNLRVRKVGEKTFVRATLRVPDYMSLEEAHELSVMMESNIIRAIGNAEIAFHIEPTGTKEVPMEGLIEKLAREVAGVKEAHEVSTVYTKGKLYITLHAQVEPKMSIEEAHEIAGKIEKRVIGNIQNIENITVHIEPFSAERVKSHMIDENEIRRIIQTIGESHQQNLQIRKIVSYIANTRHFINIDCSFSGKISVEEAHEIASLAEELVRKRFTKTIVTVHVEPGDKAQWAEASES